MTLPMCDMTQNCDGRLSYGECLECGADRHNPARVSWRKTGGAGAGDR